MTYTLTRRGAVLALAITASIPNVALSGNEISNTDEGMNQMMIAGPENQIATYARGETDGLPILFLHGDSGRASQWEPVMQVLGAGYSFDFSGHGASEPHGAGDYSLATRAADMRAAVTALGLDRFAIVAHSGSVGTALEYAKTHGDQVAGVMLIDPATDPRQMPAEIRDGFMAAIAGPDGAEAVKGYYASIGGSNPAVIAQVQADAGVVDPDARLGFAQALINWNPEEALAGYTGPLEILITPANDNPAALHHLADITPTMIPDTGHWVHLDAPEAVADAVKGFILTLNN